MKNEIIHNRIVYIRSNKGDGNDNKVQPRDKNAPRWKSKGEIFQTLQLVTVNEIKCDVTQLTWKTKIESNKLRNNILNSVDRTPNCIL